MFELALAKGPVSYYNSFVDIHPSARKHGIADADIEHATVRDDGSELAIHAMAMRPKQQRLLPGG